MTGKPTPKKIAAELRRMLYGTDHPPNNIHGQCRTLNLSYSDFAKICGCTDYNDVTPDLCNSVYDEGLELRLVFGFGNHTILIGGDYHCKPQSLDWS